MNLLRVLICLCLVVYVTCDEESTLLEHGESETSSSEMSNVSDSDNPGSTEVMSTQSHTDEEESTIILDISNDTILTVSENISEENATAVTQLSSTAFSNDSAEGIANTTAVDEDDLEPEINRTACSLNLCRNGGTCVEDLNDESLFSCICPTEFVGLLCGTEDRCKTDENGELCKDGDCFYAKDDSVRFCRCFQDMHWDEENKRCRDSDPPCFPNPCWNGGTCFVENDAALCHCFPGFEGQNCSVQNKCGDCVKGNCLLDATHTTKYCKCFKGLYWDEEKKTCEATSLPCKPNPCGNNGSCIPYSDTEFNCSCAEGFSGSSCEVVDLCTSDEDCGEHGSCAVDEDEKTRSCQCEEGFYKVSNTCDEIVKPCRPNPCNHDGLCITLSENAFNCTCSPGYTGATCTVRDRCKMDGGKGFCAEAECTDMHDLGLYTCTCSDGQYFDYSKRTCIELDLCPLVKCDPTERCSAGNCECMENYKRNNSTGKCEPNICSNYPCPAPDMVCEEGSKSSDYKCSCKEGYAFNGTHCNEVLCVFPSLNECDQRCSVVEGVVQCDCHEGFDLQEDNRTCAYIGNSTCYNKTCDHGSCVAEGVAQTCICSAGYTEVDGNCVDICTAGQLPQGVCPSNQCEPGPKDGYRCKCEGKYILSKDQITCEVRSVCQEDEVGGKTCAGRNAKCIRKWEKDEGFECVCSNGTVETAAGCRDICSLESNQRRCSTKGATCGVDAEGGMVCRCPPYFQANQDGKCNQPADISYIVAFPLDGQSYRTGSRIRRSLDTNLDSRRILQDVTLTAKTMFSGFNRANILSCSTTSGYTVCRIELQFRSVEASDLNRLKIDDICMDDGDSEKCVVPPSLVLTKGRMSKDVEIQSTDPCDADIQGDVCGSETTCTSSPQQTRHFNCSCKPGFAVRGKMYPFAGTRSIVEICKDIDECVVSDYSCPTNSLCINTIGSYLCTCKPGYRKVEESSDTKCVELCNPSPCTHGACSSRGDHEFDCTCDAGYRGAFCNLQDKNFKDAKINTVIVGVVLGGILLLTLILSVVCISRIKKKKYLEDSDKMMYHSREMTERRRVVGGAINNAYQRE